MKLKYLILSLFCFFSYTIHAQVNADLVIKQFIEPKLKELDLSQDEAMKAISSNGINFSNTNEIIENRDKIIQILEKVSIEKKKNNRLNTNRSTNGMLGNRDILVEKDSLKNQRTKTDSLNVQGIKKDSLRKESKLLEEEKPIISKRYGLHLINQFGSSPVSGNFENYIIGEGDKIQINIFGKSQANLIYEVNMQGFIQPSQMPKIFVQNLTLRNAKKLLKERFRQYYLFDEGEFDATIYASRSIRVSILGEVARPGAYEIKASQTLLNLISLAGGVQESGSIRSIHVIRNDKIIPIDFYEFLHKPSLPSSYFLQNNDVVKINLYENIIEIKGEVRRPMQYETTPKENLIDAITLAGGVLPSAYNDLVQLKTHKNGFPQTEEYKLIDVMSKVVIVLLKDGDEIIIKAAQQDKKPIVKISGEVLYDGEFDFNSNNSLKKILEKSQPKSTASLNQVFILRKDTKNGDQLFSYPAENLLNNSIQDVPLAREDSVLVFSKEQFANNFKISIEGEVKNPQSIHLTYGDSVSIKTMIAYGGGLTINATNFAYIYRKNPFNFNKTDYLYVDLQKAANTFLKSGDRLVIYNLGNFDINKSIQISGEVNKTLNLVYSPTMKIKDLITMAEGLKVYADLNNITISRLTISGDQINRTNFQVGVNHSFEVINPIDFELKPFDIVIVRPIPNYKKQEFAKINGEVAVPGFYPIVENQNFFSDFISNAKGFTSYADVKNILLIRSNASNPVAFDPELALKNPHSIHFDPIVNEGDEIIVQRLRNSIYINKLSTMGFADTLNTDVYKEFLYDGTKNAYQFIKSNTGGIKSKYSKKYIYVIQTNGRIKRTASFLFFNFYPSIQPGDKIEIGLKEVKDKNKKEGKKFDWDKTLAQILSLGSTFALIRLYTK